MTNAANQPIAIIGMSCRLPGANDPDTFWRLLREGVDAITDVPDGRWPDSDGDGAGGEYRRGGFVDGVELFDAAFFGISPTEATAMDPQQRIALELAWEALEHARLAPDTLRGSATGVYVGAIGADYAALQPVTAHAYTGTHRAIIANRVSYVLGLRGPSLTLDTGQSSSLVAVHLACESLRRGESGVAIAGGVNLNLLGETTARIGAFGALSADGRCKTFDADADGYVRGEGGAFVVLKPLSAAVADGDVVHCVIRGGAVNNDGGGDTLTAPSRAAQTEVITAACASAGVRPADLHYVELHGTGTPVGDPVEAAALGAALAPPGETPLLVGSVKTNIGHLEGAAGIAGLLKVALAIRHGELPASLHFSTPNPDIPLAELGLRVVESTSFWPRPGHPLLAGVSSFGMGGTNCHLVVGEAPPSQPPTRIAAPFSDAPWVLSAASPTALCAQAGRLHDLMRTTPVQPADLALALANTRARLTHRAVVLGDRRTDKVGCLRSIAGERPDPQVVTGSAVGGRCVFTFPGQGSQWPEMAAELLATDEVFAEHLRACADALAPFVDYPLLDVLTGATGAPGLDRVDVVQPALWAVMVSLAGLWRAHGVTPDVVIGHSQGEIAAATVVGALSLEDGARVVALRSKAIRRIAGAGGMLSVAAPLSVARAAAEASGVTVAAVNGPASVVLSGPVMALTELRDALVADGHRCRLVPVDYASHSSDVDAVRDEVLAALAPIRPRSCDTEFVSTLTGEPVDTATLDAEYWFASLRRPVRFADAVRHALAADCGLFVECSPHPVLVAAVEETADEAERDVAVLGSLRRDHGDPRRFERSLAEAFTRGAPVDWSQRCAHKDAQVVDLPTYAFQRQRYWVGELPTRRAATVQIGRTGQSEQDTAPLPVARSRRELLDLVLTVTADVLGHADHTEIAPSRTFKDLGIDSATAVDLRNRLRAATGTRLPAGLTFDHPTPDRLADFLHRGTAPVATVSTVVTRHDDPIAIVGMGCRYPGGVTSPEELWRLVTDGTDAISGFPTDRGWDIDTLFADGPNRSGTSDTRHGGFLDDADRFDARLFGISPREAAAMDPQQRVLLEVAWEALERAGVDHAGLRGSATGVFLGAMAPDYGPRLHQPVVSAEGHLLTGTALSVVSGRIAYTLGLSGPAMTVDTACSSSLVAVHLAVQALRRGECSLALAGGATVMATPGMFVEFSRQSGLAPDGRCKAFADDADGTGWAEGAGVLVLERLSDARRNGHPVLALVRGAAVNSDGRSNGLTAPNGPAQEAVIRAALADAGLSTADITAIEAHGTGTPLGDPIEATALLATYGDRTGEPAWLGSIKSNIGHTQAAAGVAGVIKMVQALRHRTLPRTLHATEPSRHIDWDSGAVRLLTEPVTLPADGPARAAVSSFGISGTNSHVIIEHTPESDVDTPAEVWPLAWPLSARATNALRAQARRLRDFAATATDADLATTAALLARRARLDVRAVVVATDRDELTAALDALVDGVPHPSAIAERPVGQDVRTVFVFPGQGSQWAGMAVDLFDTDEVFAERLAECDAALAPHTGWSLLDVLRGANGAPELAGSDVVQPALFAVMVALAAVWQHAGVQPAAVLGHSQGEIAAATVAGVLSLDDAAAMVVRRARLLMELTGLGGMVSVPLTADEARARIEPWTDRLWLAIESSPVSSVVAGDADALDEFVAACAEGPHPLRTGRVAIDYASHTPHTERLRDRLLAAIDTLVPNPATTPVCSGTAGEMIDAAELTPEYWYRNLRHPVLFERAVRAANDSGNTLFIEVSAHPVLTGAVRETVADAGGRGAAIGTLRRGEGGRRQLLTAAAQAFTLGVDVHWPALVGEVPAGRPVDVPTYPFERDRHWLEVAPALTGGLVEAAHPLLGAMVPLANDDGLVITGRLSRRGMPWLTDHAVGADVLLPGTAFVELAARAARLSGRTEVADLTLHAPLALPAEGAVTLQLAVAGDGTLTVHSRLESDVDDAGWTRHATGRLTDAPTTGEQLAVWPPDALELDLTGAYEQLAENGYHYGPAFQGLRRVWQAAGERFAEVVLPDAVRGDAGRYAVHPALLDAALHPIVLAADGERLLPFSWTGVRIAASGTDTLRVRITELGDGRVSLTGYDETGRWCLTVDELVLLPAAAGPTRGAPVQVIEWTAPTGIEPVDVTGVLWPVVDGVGDAEDVRTGLERAGATAPHHYDLSSLADMSTGEQPPAVVVPVLPAVCAVELPYAAHDVLYPVLDLVQGWLGDERFDNSRLVLLTRGAVTGADVNGMAGGPVWGLVRSAESENPGRFALVDVDPGDGGDVADVPWAAVAAALAAGETQLAVRDGELLVPRLARRRPAEMMDTTWTDGTVLITGGTGGLGARLAEHLVTRHGATRLLLTSRRGAAAPGATELVERLAELGATAEVAACDVADRRALERLITTIPADTPLTGVVHAAGLLDDTTVVGLGAQQLDDVLAAKARGAWYLHELTAELPLARFVLFSSVAGVVGNPGQGNYAAANMFLDRLAALRHAAGLPAVSIAWGLWDNGESSMSGTLSEADIARLLRSGITALDADRGFAMFDAALGVDEPAVVAAAWDNAALRARAERDDLPAVLRGTVAVTARPTTAAVPVRSTVDAPVGLAARLAGMSESDGRKHVLELVRRHVAVVLGHSDPSAVELDRTFSELGFDSLTAVELRNRLDAEAGIRLPATIAFDHPTVGAIAGYVYITVAPAPAAPEDLLRDALAKVDAVAPNPDENTRTKLIAILQHSIARLGTGAQPRPEQDEGPELDVTSASDEELFALIDNQN